MPPDWIVPGSATGLLGLVFLLVIRGYLVPPRLVHKEEYDRLKSERDEWKALALQALQQNRDLVAGTQVLSQALQSLPAARGGA